MSPALPTSGGYAGPAWMMTGANGFNAISFLVSQAIAGKAFAGLVKVVAVTGGGVGQPPTVSVQPLVNQIDGFGQQTPHGNVHDIPCFRLQGGNGACILDPAVGDIGQAIICDRDISTVKATGAMSQPGSWRQNDWADGCYFGGFLNGAPASYLQITGAGINIVTAGTINIMAGGGTTIDGKPFLPHEHKDVEPGSGTSGPVA